MGQNRLSTILNMSNQGNMENAERTSLSQSTYIVVLGLGCLGKILENSDKIPVSVNISKSGELEISGFGEDFINEENIRIYSDKKVTQSEN